MLGATFQQTDRSVMLMVVGRVLVTALLQTDRSMVMKGGGRC